jgi:carboxypeptidase family protein
MTLALMVSACGGYSPAAPTSPTAARPPDPTFTVSGVVVGQGSAPVEGAQVRVASQAGTTDGNGYYSLTGVPGSYGGVSAVKAGYSAARKILTVNGDMRVDFELGPRVAVYTLSGVVSEETPAGLVPIEGALVEEYSCEDVPPSPPFFGNACPVLMYQATTTDKNGAYRFAGLYGGTRNSIGASKEGFDDPLVPNVQESPDAPDTSRKVTINGDTHYQIQLVRH